MTNSKHQQQGPLKMQGQQLEFPVTYRLKAVMTTALSDAENRRQLNDVFEKLKIGYVYHGKNRSGKGTYVSFTVEVTLNDRKTMEQLYFALKEIDNLKFAL